MMMMLMSMHIKMIKVVDNSTDDNDPDPVIHLSTI
jgi:hypothetical protein